VAFGCDGRLPVAVDTPVDASFTLEVNEYNGAVEPRLLLRHAQDCAPASVALVGEADDYLATVWEELAAALPGEEDSPTAQCRRVHDRRGRGVAGALAALVASGERVLVVCADAARRMEHLAGRLGGFSLCSYHALTRDPNLADSFTHLALLDPPACAHADAVARGGRPEQHVHLLWGELELRFAQRVHERDHDLRPAVADLYRALRAAGALAAESLQVVLEGGAERAADLASLAPPAQARRPAALAGRLLRVLAELELVEIDTVGAAVAVRPAQRTSLERSPAFRAHALRLAEGRGRLAPAVSPVLAEPVPVLAEPVPVLAEPVRAA
jgi:single-stranded-DNA-specific exonuclease